MPFGKIYLDSNVFISAHGETGEIPYLLSEMLEAASGRAAAPFATSELTLAEVPVRPIRHADEISVQEFRTMLLPSEWLDVQGISRQILLSSARLRGQHRALKLPDAIHIASALASDCTHVLTADLRLRGRYSTDPFAAVDIATPSAATLAEIIQWLRA